MGSIKVKRRKTPQQDSARQGVRVIERERERENKALPACMSRAPLQPYVLISRVQSGAIRKVPMPDPHTAMPVARARHLSK